MLIVKPGDRRPKCATISKISVLALSSHGPIPREEKKASKSYKGLGLPDLKSNFNWEGHLHVITGKEFTEKKIHSLNE